MFAGFMLPPSDAKAALLAVEALLRAGVHTLEVGSLAKLNPRLRLPVRTVLRVLEQSGGDDFSPLKHELGRLDVLDRRKPPAPEISPKPAPPDRPRPRGVFVRRRRRR
jgi:hypothetical protein